MKKGIIVTIAVSLLLAGSVAGAAGSSLIGKKVAKEVQIEVDGKKTKSPAVIIDGVTYAPVREVGEITGFAVTYKGGVVRMNSTNDTQEAAKVSEPTTESVGKIDNLLAGKRKEIQINEEDIKKREAAIEKSIKSYETFEIYKGLKYEDSDAYKGDLKYIEDLKGKNETLTKEIAELERQKAELSANK
ncbi:hypothetical protein [Paenibacillus sp. S-12]|uniref:hypothetical protein n=1 Tax=Paenibacillus sp. S-12 TaxID=3031371 RepID=UPI0025A063B7|nr:hypothetical protein [Paenibacillus sp. S-12]